MRREGKGGERGKKGRKGGRAKEEYGETCMFFLLFFCFLLSPCFLIASPSCVSLPPPLPPVFPACHVRSPLPPSYLCVASPPSQLAQAPLAFCRRVPRHSLYDSTRPYMGSRWREKGGSGGRGGGAEGGRQGRRKRRRGCSAHRHPSWSLSLARRLEARRDDACSGE